ncbi:hypothetical protein NQZ68_013339 [Dissostichus eleginoides]|nr:hypothetical protein NQZ68_013339 [Dissostichus eleginoides]
MTGKRVALKNKVPCASCHEVPGGGPALELTLSVSPTRHQNHPYQTPTFHCPPLAPATKTGCSPRPRHCPVFTSSLNIKESPRLSLGPSTGQASWLVCRPFPTLL